MLAFRGGTGALANGKLGRDDSDLGQRDTLVVGAIPWVSGTSMVTCTISAANGLI
jgi:hypothetical protein